MKGGRGERREGGKKHATLNQTFKKPNHRLVVGLTTTFKHQVLMSLEQSLFSHAVFS